MMEGIVFLRFTSDMKLVGRLTGTYNTILGVDQGMAQTFFGGIFLRLDDEEEGGWRSKSGVSRR